ncbi:sugar ABC transporter substrate-binding protein [Rhizobium anhuiense]|uniref:sugar ABC transporter substrate-binding protein n=1 Tax=Rhizobium anhuiense TaxID=1184720 RepID=UPI000BE8E196|nr:sugar ABC transporter substrate-binding protein [Rhizobium anhuiense]PDS63052.1 sugar ABC transporter substrate-binding protein [Rhizobium anhuiense]
MKAYLGILRGVFAVALTVSASVTTANAAKIAVIAGKPDDTFWQPVKKGVDDARKVVELTNGSVSFLQLANYDNLGPDAANLIRTAVSQGVDGIVVANWVPDAMDAAIKDAVAKGVKVILYNAGNIDKAREVGALNYVGSDEYVAGQAAGKYFLDKGFKNILCVNHVPGSFPLEQRCKGVVDAVTPNGGKSKQLPLPSTQADNAAAVAQTIKATLLTDPSIDAILTLNPAVADWAASGIMQAGVSGKVALGSFDMNEAGLGRIKSGGQTFAIDQQPYLQSYLAVGLLNSFLEYGLQLPTAPVLTGPGFVDSANIDATLGGVKKGAR